MRVYCPILDHAYPTLHLIFLSDSDGVIFKFFELLVEFVPTEDGFLLGGSVGLGGRVLQSVLRVSGRRTKHDYL